MLDNIHASVLYINCVQCTAQIVKNRVFLESPLCLFPSVFLNGHTLKFGMYTTFT